MEKEKLREMEWLAQGHTAGKCQESESNLGFLSPNLSYGSQNTVATLVVEKADSFESE